MATPTYEPVLDHEDKPLPEVSPEAVERVRQVLADHKAEEQERGAYYQIGRDVFHRDTSYQICLFMERDAELLTKELNRLAERSQWLDQALNVCRWIVQASDCPESLRSTQDAARAIHEAVLPHYRLADRSGQ